MPLEAETGRGTRAIFGSPRIQPTRRSPSYNLLVNFASLLEGYVRWDKKYLEWYPEPSIVGRATSSLAPTSSSLSAAIRVTNILCRCVQAAPQTVYLEQLAAAAAAAPAAAAPLPGCRVRIPELPPSGHWSAPLASTLCQPPAQPPPSSCSLSRPPPLAVSFSFSFSSHRRTFCSWRTRCQEYEYQQPLACGYAPDFYPACLRAFY